VAQRLSPRVEYGLAVDRLRLAELLTGLSLVADIGMGLSPGEAGRAALVAMELADATGARGLSDIYYTTLLQHVGCTAYAHEAALMLGGDEIAVKRAAVHTDFGSARDIVRSYLLHLAPAAGILVRVRAAGAAAVHAREIVHGYSLSNCEVAARTAERVGLGPGVTTALLDIYEQWNGDGGPRRIGGEAIAEPARIAQVAVTAALFHTVGGPDAAVEALRHRAARALDPRLVELVCAEPGRVLGVLDTADALTAAVGAEPWPPMLVSEPGLDRVCRAFGDAVDLKTPLHHGHSAGVAELAVGAAEQLGLEAREVAALRRAGYLHDIGRAAVPNGVWGHAGPLSWAEEEQVRLHPHYSERVLARCGPLAALAPLAGAHHERLDGSGYHRQLRAGQLGTTARVLATADAFQALVQVTVHRPALSAEAAATALAVEARAGRLDPDMVRGLLEASGRPAPAVRQPRPAGLTERQVEVLRLVARGLSNPKIARRLAISRRTAEHHVQDVYSRIGVSSRAAAALFAMEHDLLRDG
jgi:HD-GYP domain-containing protein (c-di-GMP phosphodiesterase class II)